MIPRWISHNITCRRLSPVLHTVQVPVYIETVSVYTSERTIVFSPYITSRCLNPVGLHEHTGFYVKNPLMLVPTTRWERKYCKKKIEKKRKKEMEKKINRNIIFFSFS